MKYLVLLFASLYLSACASLEGYKFGDGTKKVVGTAVKIVKAKRDYCSETDPAAKKLLLESLKILIGAYPDYGICAIDLEDKTDEVPESELEVPSTRNGDVPDSNNPI